MLEQSPTVNLSLRFIILDPSIMIPFSSFVLRSSQLLSTVLVAASTLIAPVAQAGLSVSPLVVELNSRQGQAQGTITVGNSGEDPFRARSYAVPFTYDRETGFKELPKADNDLTPYLQFSPPEVSIPGADKRRVRFITRLAPSLPDGEYRAMIFTETLNQIVPPEVTTSGETTVTTTILPRLGVAVYVRKGKLSPSLAIDSFRFNALDQQPQVLVKNTGKASAIVGPFVFGLVSSSVNQRVAILSVGVFLLIGLLLLQRVETSPTTR